MKVAHLTTHINMGGIPVYIYTVGLKLKELGVEQIVIASGGSFADKFIVAGIPVFTFDIKTKFAFHWKLFMQLPQMIRLLRKEKVSLIHAHTRVGQVLAQWIQIFSGIPCVSTCHGFYKFKLSRKLFPAWGSRVIAISDLVAEDLVMNHGLSKRRVRTIINGIETQVFSCDGQLAPIVESRRFMGLKEQDFAICFVARMIEDKGPRDLLMAIQILIKKNINIRVFMVGDGKDKEMLVRLSDEMGLSAHVRFMGNVFDVKPIFFACNALVHPVRVSEGFGLSIAEAMACGLPVIVNEQWALGNMMRDKQIGEFVTSGSPDQIASVLERWSRQPALVKRLGQNARATAVNYFDIKKMSRDVYQVYQEVMDEVNPLN